MKGKLNTTIITALTLAITACSATDPQSFRPEVENNDLANYEADLTSCRKAALENEELNSTTDGGLLGATAGAIASAASDGDLVTGIVVGAIVGAAGGSAKTNQDQQNAIVKCMQDKGYNVVVGD